MVKRLIALEGDVVEKFSANDSSPKEIVIPKGYCWVEGDNFRNSIDSKTYGPVSTGKG